jgi:hypothetical protein
VGQPPEGTRIFFYVLFPIAFVVCLWLLLTTDEPSPRLVIGTLAGGVAVIATLVHMLRRRD